jgi:hypothetical protein
VEELPRFFLENVQQSHSSFLCNLSGLIQEARGCDMEIAVIWYRGAFFLQFPPQNGFGQPELGLPEMLQQ